MTISIEEKDLFGRWCDIGKRQAFASVDEARTWCVEMSDMTGIAYRVMVDGEPVEIVDMEASFWALVAQHGKEEDNDG